MTFHQFSGLFKIRMTQAKMPDIFVSSLVIQVLGNLSCEIKVSKMDIAASNETIVDAEGPDSLLSIGSQSSQKALCGIVIFLLGIVSFHIYQALRSNQSDNRRDCEEVSFEAIDLVTMKNIEIEFV